ncbi:hypothetical protein AVEN_48885-1 [Araneus ventricosus]|uniref:Uncharacterized protein n=1 Tax=Araneus ventricosus TaxID=182803 RepID=A0A4Y2AGQ2_ARAVE|nr:hypothetical protein AVEN_48885-1 [Araneus ventricosus]
MCMLSGLPIQLNGVNLWSDSQNVLNWIHLPPKKGNQFIVNRVAQIKSLVPQAQWNHIAGTSDPADSASRGISPNSLLNHSLWWSGPQWLSSNEPFSPSLIETFVIEPEFDCECVASQFIRWHFIPPYSPHFGGIWEAAVKKTKNHLLRACKAAVLNFEVLSILLCQVEACLNSRPLVPVSSDPNDVRALTPLLEIPYSSRRRSPVDF